MNGARAVRGHGNEPAGMARAPMRRLFRAGFGQMNAVQLAGKNGIIRRQQNMPQPL